MEEDRTGFDIWLRESFHPISWTESKRFERSEKYKDGRRPPPPGMVESQLNTVSPSPSLYLYLPPSLSLSCSQRTLSVDKNQASRRSGWESSAPPKRPSSHRRSNPNKVFLALSASPVPPNLGCPPLCLQIILPISPLKINFSRIYAAAAGSSNDSHFDALCFSRQLIRSHL